MIVPLETDELDVEKTTETTAIAPGLRCARLTPRCAAPSPTTGACLDAACVSAMIRPKFSDIELPLKG